MFVTELLTVKVLKESLKISGYEAKKEKKNKLAKLLGEAIIDEKLTVRPDFEDVITRRDNRGDLELIDISDKSVIKELKSLQADDIFEKEEPRYSLETFYPKYHKQYLTTRRLTEEKKIEWDEKMDLVSRKSREILSELDKYEENKIEEKSEDYQAGYKILYEEYEILQNELLNIQQEIKTARENEEKEREKRKKKSLEDRRVREIKYRRKKEDFLLAEKEKLKIAREEVEKLLFQKNELRKSIEEMKQKAGENFKEIKDLLGDEKKELSKEIKLRDEIIEENESVIRDLNERFYKLNEKLIFSEGYEILLQVYSGMEDSRNEQSELLKELEKYPTLHALVKKKQKAEILLIDKERQFQRIVEFLKLEPVTEHVARETDEEYIRKEIGAMRVLCQMEKYNAENFKKVLDYVRNILVEESIQDSQPESDMSDEISHLPDVLSDILKSRKQEIEELEVRLLILQLDENQILSREGNEEKVRLLESLEKENEKYVKLFIEYMKELEDKSGIINRNLEEIRNLKQEIENRSLENQLLKSNQENAKSDYETKIKKIEEIAALELREAKTEFEEQREELEKDLQLREDEINSLKQENEKMIQELEKLEYENLKIKSERRKDVSFIATQESKIRENGEYTIKMMEQNEKLKLNFVKLENDYAQLLQQHQKLIEANYREEEDLKILKDENEGHTREIEKLKSELEIYMKYLAEIMGKYQRMWILLEKKGDYDFNIIHDSLLEVIEERKKTAVLLEEVFGASEKRLELEDLRNFISQNQKELENLNKHIRENEETIRNLKEDLQSKKEYSYSYKLTVENFTKEISKILRIEEKSNYSEIQNQILQNKFSLSKVESQNKYLNYVKDIYELFSERRILVSKLNIQKLATIRKAEIDEEIVEHLATEIKKLETRIKKIKKEADKLRNKKYVKDLAIDINVDFNDVIDIASI